MIDLCYQTLALADIDRAKYREQIREERRADSLAAARRTGSGRCGSSRTSRRSSSRPATRCGRCRRPAFPPTNPQVAKAIDYLLNRQQAFGGWMDPLQSFENFRTPFRETQMAVLALSSYFPARRAREGLERAARWSGSRRSGRSCCSSSMTSGIAPSPAVRKQIEAATRSPDALSGRPRWKRWDGSGGRCTIPSCSAIPSKLVQRTAAWALRQIVQPASRDAVRRADCGAGLAPTTARAGARRASSPQHFAALGTAARNGARAGESRSTIPCRSVRMQAVKGLWQFWFWTPDAATKGAIEDTLLAAMAKPQPAWVDEQPARRRLQPRRREHPLSLQQLGAAAGRAGGSRARDPRPPGGGIAAGREIRGGPGARPGTRRRRRCCGRSPSFRCAAATSTIPRPTSRKTAPPVYNRIGNDIEQIAFFGEAADRMARGARRRCSDSPIPRCGGWPPRPRCWSATRASATSTASPAPSGPGQATADAKVEKMPEAAEVAARPESAAVRSGCRRQPRRRSASHTKARRSLLPRLRRADPHQARQGRLCLRPLPRHAHAVRRHLLDGDATSSTPADPENSLILRKPTSTSETEGVAGSTTLAHGGGVRFTKDSPEYATILEWIKGAKE